MDRPGPAAPEVALTFDDGPSESCTGPILDILKSKDVRATFFMLGRHLAELPDVARRVAGEGHTIGLHGYSHRGLRSAWDVRVLRHEIERTRQALLDAAGVETRLYRAPHGRAAPWIGPWLRRRGLNLVGWDIAAGDWRRPEPRAIAERVLRRLRPGSIILLHDGEPTRTRAARENTVRALPQILDGGCAAGFRFVPLAGMDRRSPRDDSPC
jgi:peptidoglycan-N-acetylglucosamine deacetylase